MKDHKKNQLHNLFPAFIIGAVEGVIVILSLYCFFLGKGIETSSIIIYMGIAIIFIAILLAFGAFFTRKEEINNHGGESKIVKIYQALDIDDRLKNAMVEDTLQENKTWQKEWQQGSNATGNLSPRDYALSVCLGFLSGGGLTFLNNYIAELPDYKALFIPFVLLGTLGFLKYKVADKNPVNGMLFLSVTGIIAAAGAYYAGALFS